jgi:arylsulfatase A-like enzyme
LRRAAPCLLVLCTIAPGCSGRQARPSVLLISIDALRADHVGAYGYPRPTTPFLDSLAARGQRFERAYVPLPATAPGHATLLTSLHPAQHGVVSNTMALPDQAQTLAEVLQQQGYATLGAVAVFYLKARYGFAQGFGAFSDAWSPRARGNAAERRSAADVNASLATLLASYAKQKRDQPFFLFVHYYDVHAPYQRRPRYTVADASATEAGPDGSSATVDAYDAGIRYVDEQIRELHTRLQQLGLADNLLICVTADHGEQLGDHGYAQGHADIYRETIRVPLIVQGPGVRAGRVERPVSSMDVAASLLRLLGLRFDAASNVPPEAGGAVPWDQAAPARPLLVLGYPGHTQSVGLIEDDLWFIRNLDYFYKEVLVERPAGDAPAPDFIPLKAADHDGDESLFVVDAASPDGIAALEVAVEARLERRDCKGELSLRLRRRLRYLEQPLPIDGAIRVRVPATSRDSVIVGIRSPCAAEVAYRATPRARSARERTRAERATRSIESALWRKLPVPRKQRSQDELYDVAADPQMLANLVQGRPGDAARLDALIDRLWSAYARRALSAAAGGDAETAEEHEALRSLGYVR